MGLLSSLWSTGRVRACATTSWGPHQGVSGTLRLVEGEIRIPHPAKEGVHCRHRTNSTDAKIEQAGFEPGIQVHYVGDTPSPDMDKTAQ